MNKLYRWKCTLIVSNDIRTYEGNHCREYVVNAPDHHKANWRAVELARVKWSHAKPYKTECLGE